MCELDSSDRDQSFAAVAGILSRRVHDLIWELGVRDARLLGGEPPPLCVTATKRARVCRTVYERAYRSVVP
jgi:hypothetical protein